MEPETYYTGLGKVKLEKDTPPEPAWLCDACGLQRCVERGKKPTDCTRVRPVAKWRLEDET